MITAASIHDLVKSTLCQWGAPAPLDVWRTLVVDRGGFIGHRYHFEGGYAMWAEGWDTVQFYDADGKPTKAVAVKRGPHPAYETQLWQEAYAAACIAEMAAAAKSKQSG